MNNTVTIREAKIEDAKTLLEIYQPYVEHTEISFEYEVPSVEEFQTRIANTLKNYPYYVAENAQGEIVGYAYASAFKTRKAYSWSAETSIYVKDNQHGTGVGKMLYEALEQTLIAQNVCTVCACIAYPHPQSERFHEKMGYQLVAHFHNAGYKHDKWVDMIWMEKPLRKYEVPPKDFIPYEELNK